MRLLPAFLLLAALLGLSQCKHASPAPVDQLPPATQAGANTFGCLVNGQAWTPRGNDGFSNYSVVLDRDANGDILDIHTYRIYGQDPDESQAMVLFATQIKGIGAYLFRSPQRTRASFEYQKTHCYWSSRDSATTYRRGSLTITRLDRVAGIISGTFAFTLYKPGCDSVRITQGRFDRKL
jgi:hypothetical protein